MDKLVKLFSCTKKKTLVDLSSFIFKAMCIRIFFFHLTTHKSNVLFNTSIPSRQVYSNLF